jgi:hypothetical protein
MNNDEQLRLITHQVMSDKTIHPLHIAPQVSWPLAQMIRLAAVHPLRNKWGKKECIAIAKKIERAVNAKHPLPMLYGPAQLEPIMSDDQPQEITLTMRDLWLIVGSVHLGVRHPELPETPRRICTDAAKQIEARIIEAHPDSWMLLQMGWDERYDT